MTIAQRMRGLMAPRREKALEQRRIQIEEFYDKQIADLAEHNMLISWGRD